MGTSPKKYRLITRSDFDGLVSAVLLRSLDMINEIMFVHPKDMQDGKIEVTSSDITTNLPYAPGCHMAFDHHYSETLRVGGDEKSNYIIDATMPSASRVVYNYFGGKKSFPGVSDEMMNAVDKADSAAFSIQEVLEPKGWSLLSFLMDARTGLGRFRHFRISNYQLMMELIFLCQNLPIHAILQLPDVKERCDLYFLHQEKFKAQVQRCSRLLGATLVLDLRGEDVIYTGNRFLVYALFPDCEVSIHVMRGRENRNTVLAVGKSIFQKGSRVNIGELMLTYGGGGHAGAGTCQVPNEMGDRILGEVIKKIEQENNPTDP